MCGLVGVAGTLDKLNNAPDDHSVFSGLLYVAAFRGTDSTGIAGRSFGMDKGDVVTLKTTLASPEFLDLNKAKGIISASDQMILGHTRSRTVGDVSKKNAQPFDFDNVCGAHNGTLSYSAKNKLEGQGKVCGTDSEALWYRIDKDGFDEALKLTDDKDAMALTWYDKKRHRLNFYRNEHRPLFYCYSPDRKKVYWASEPGMLYLILNRSKVKFEKIRQLPDNLHWSQPLPDKMGAVFPKPETRFCKQPKAYTAPASSGTARESAQTFIVRDHRASSQPAGTMGTGSVVSGRTSLLNRKPADICNLADLRAKYGKATASNTSVDLGKFRLDRMVVRSATQGGPYYKSAYSARSYDEQRFEAKMNEGCCVCGSCPSWGEPIKFLRDDNVVCASCITEARQQAEHGKVDGETLLLVQQMS